MKYDLLNWPLMYDQITEEDRECLIKFIREAKRFTQSENVEAFEQEWSDWLGVKHSVFVNSGASANLITMAWLNEKRFDDRNEVIVPTLTWVSDIATVIQNRFTPVFVDIDPHHLGMNIEDVEKKITKKTVAVFLTHILGFSALSKKLQDLCRDNRLFLIEDCCEAHGAMFDGRKIGTFSFMSNFSSYFAHHMTTIEGGMVCTDNVIVYEELRMFRSHGLIREIKDKTLRDNLKSLYPDLNSDFIFKFMGYNVRNNELQAVLGRSQLKRLDQNNLYRQENFKLFLSNLDSEKYRTDLAEEGSVNYAFPLILKHPDVSLSRDVESLLTLCGVEFRKGLSGGGNQCRQPYLKHLNLNPKDFPNVEHIHDYAWYIGNYPGIPKEKILRLCDYLNGLKSTK